MNAAADCESPLYHRSMVWVGVACLLAACGVALRFGGRQERLCAGVTALAWTVVLIAQLVFGTRRMEPIIAGDVVYSVGLLGLCYFEPRAWLWLLIGCEALAFLLHAYLYNGEVMPSYAYMAALNAVGFAELGILAVVSLWRAFSLRRQRTGAEPVSGNSPRRSG